MYTFSVLHVSLYLTVSRSVSVMERGLLIDNSLSADDVTSVCLHQNAAQKATTPFTENSFSCKSITQIDRVKLMKIERPDCWRIENDIYKHSGRNAEQRQGRLAADASRNQQNPIGGICGKRSRRNSANAARNRQNRSAESKKFGQDATQQMSPEIDQPDRRNHRKVGQDAIQQMPPGITKPIGGITGKSV
ncbi:Hypothetical protein FKW44_017527 [Caligus rogercresseyi]|uniref:Uncharacterized protein n=1 Tax=Caligus rogercresseyi TaxID=217165 RepID=A0A7T8JVZ9_CALRO|nr:Hypothetical protein FKW44_017527 [Caligus rogercresseyi]